MRRNGNDLWKACCILCMLSLCLLCSCATRTEYIEVPTPVEIDLTDVVDPVLERRPDNSTIQVNTDVKDILDVMENAASYMYAWEMWQEYAELLESTLLLVGEKVGSTPGG